MKFLEVERVVENDNWDMSKSHSHKHYELYFLEAGTRTHFLQSQIYLIEKNSFVLIPPNVVHRTEGGPFARTIINFEITSLSTLNEDFIKKLFAYSAVALVEPEINKFKSLMKEIYQEYSETYARNDNLLEVKVSELLICLNRHVLSHKNLVSPSIANNSLIQRVITSIEKDYKEVSLYILAKKLFVSKEHLSREFKRHTNMTIGEYINNKKISEAVYLLVNTELGMEQIAESCGFSSANYFGLALKKTIGMSPLNYRKNKLNPHSTRET